MIENNVEESVLYTLTIHMTDEDSEAEETTDAEETLRTRQLTLLGVSEPIQYCLH